MLRLTRHPTIFLRSLAVLLLVVAVLCPFWVCPARADDSDIKIHDIQPKLAHGNVQISAKFDDLFSRKTLSTIQSGLPSLIRIHIVLKESEASGTLFSHRKEIHEVELIRSVAYDVWDELYTVETRDTTMTFTKLDTVKKVASQLERVPIMRASLLEPERAYLLEARVQIVPISAQQGSKISEWIRNPNQVNKPIVGEDSSTAFQLTPNSLVSLFVGKGESSRNSSGWFRSKPFSITESGELQF